MFTYTGSGETWTLTNVISNSAADAAWAQAFDSQYFGKELMLSADESTLVVAAPSKTNSAQQPFGVAFVYALS